MGFPDGLDMEYERKRGVKDDYKVWGLSNWNNVIAIIWEGENWMEGVWWWRWDGMREQNKV